MSDTASRVSPQPDNVEARHTLTVREVEVLFANAGVQRSHRHVLRLCQSGMLDAVKVPGGPSGDEWYVAPASVPKAIGDLKQIEAQRARRAATQRDTSHHVAREDSPIFGQDTASHGAPGPDVSDTKNLLDRGLTRSVTPSHGAADLDIYEHPYVKRLENRVDKLESKLEAQVRRTEEIQLKSQEKLLELQRMTAVGQSQTLADFMLKAKNLILGPASEAAERTVDDPQRA